MPFVNVQTNVSVPTELDGQLHAALDQALALLPAVEPGWTMTNIQPDCRIWYEGSAEPAAMVEISVYGDLLGGCAAVTERVCAILHDLLAIDPSRVYVRYSQAPYWGCGGCNY